MFNPSGMRRTSVCLLQGAFVSFSLHPLVYLVLSTFTCGYVIWQQAAAQKKRSAEASAAQAPGKRSRIAFNSASSSSTSGVHPSTLDRGHRHSDETRGRQHSDDLRGKRSDGSRRRHEDDKRFHPYPHKPDTNMGWVPRNHSSSDRSRRW
jgi:hypothetical protein